MHALERLGSFSTVDRGHVCLMNHPNEKGDGLERLLSSLHSFNKISDAKLNTFD
jgi:hypothetical protein